VFELAGSNVAYIWWTVWAWWYRQVKSADYY